MKISIIICSLNYQAFFSEIWKIRDYIKAKKKKWDIIVVSPKHTEHCIEGIKFVKDKKTGLADARMLGFKQAKGYYILYLGDDNIIDPDDINMAIEYMLSKKWMGVGFLTEVIYPITYFEKCNNIRWKHRFKEGLAKVIGTPWIYPRSIINKYGFKNGYCDDTTLGDDLEKAGFKQGYCNLKVYEKSEISSIDNIKKRFIMYAKGDQLYHDLNKYKWDLKRKVQSYLHSIIADFIPDLYYMPFYIYVASIRFLYRFKRTK